MTETNPDKNLANLIHRALVPEGYRPSSDEDIEQMLEALRGDAVSDAKLKRMLRKVNGEEPMFVRDTAISPVDAHQITAQERELVALHRSQGTPLPPELQAKLKAMEERASQPPDEEDEGDNVNE